MKRSKRFVGRRESYGISHELEDMFVALGKDLPDPIEGLKVVADFYEADNAILDHCDDSDGTVGDVFRFTACDYFVNYASLCEDKERVAALMLRLYAEDDYGVRDVLLDSASSYLPERILHSLVEQLWQRSAIEKDQDRKRHWFYGIESLAKQLRDAVLFEKASRAAWPELSTASRIEIADVYLQSGQPEAALKWLDSIPVEDHYKDDERDSLLMDVCDALGDKNRLKETAWRIFRRHRSEETLSQLLSVLGEDQRKQIIDREADLILLSGRLSYSDAAFLIDMNQIEQAEKYLMNRADQLNGIHYTVLLPLAEALTEAGRLVVASAIYRALLESILARAISKYYTHGIRYLKKLDALSLRISDWGDVVTHEDYKAELKSIHARKTSFWSKY